MTENLPASRPQGVSPAMTNAAVASLRRLAPGWSMACPVPPEAIAHLPVALVAANQAIEPCGAKAAAVMLDSLWSVFPMPAEAADRIWNGTLARYPADLVEAAIAQLIATRTWERDPPVPGQVVALLRAEYQERIDWRNKLASMERRAQLDGVKREQRKAAGPCLKDQDPSEREAFLARMREKYPDGFGLVSAAQASQPCERGDCD